MKKHSFVFFLVSASLLWLGCARENVGAVARIPAADATARYGEAPFPSDLFLVDGRIGPLPGIETVAPLETALLREQLQALDGFGTRPVIEIFFDGALDPDTVPPRTTSMDDAVFLMDAEADAPRVVPMDWRWDPVRSALVGAVVRGQVLTDGHRYAVVATSALRAATGRVGVPPALDVMRSGEDPRPAARAMADAMARAAPVLGERQIVAVTTFTTQRARDGLLRARALIDALPPPTVTFDEPGVLFVGDEALQRLLGDPIARGGEEALGWSQPTGLARRHVGAVGTGTLHGITFRAAENDGGTWAFDENGAPVVNRTVDLPVSFAVPKGLPPPGGWPVAFFGHGLGATRAQMHAFIETLAREGYVTVAIDADGHGSRHTDVDGDNNVAARLGPDFTGEQILVDGFGDVEGHGTSFDLFHGFTHVAAMRDQMRQSVVDLGQVVRALRAGVDLSPLVPGAQPGSHVDGTRIAYLGESFGGVLGSLFAAVEPDVGMFVLDVPGGGILEYAALGSPSLSPVVRLFVPAAWGLDPNVPLDRFNPMIGLGSAILDGADPLTFAPHVLRDRPLVGERPLPPRHVVILEVEGDEVLPNVATRALALAMGLPRVTGSGEPDDRFRDVSFTHGGIAANEEDMTAVLLTIPGASHGDNWCDEVGERRFQPFDEDALEFVALEGPALVVNPVWDTHVLLRRLLADFREGHTPTLVPLTSSP